MEAFHVFNHQIVQFIGGQIGEHPPVWLHWLLDLILLWTPLVLLFALLWKLVRHLRNRTKHIDKIDDTGDPHEFSGLPVSVFSYIVTFSRADQIALITLGLVSMPVLYATLELPKMIINSALAKAHENFDGFGVTLTQIEHLAVLCVAYLIAISFGGILKYILNVYKGSVGERLLRRLRLLIYRSWRKGAGSDKRTEVIPLLAQEVEPIGGFAADAFSLPVFQGGTVATILFFMFAQDPILGAAAITLLPIQLVLIPRLQKRVNTIMRQRVRQIRTLGGRLGEQAVDIQRGALKIAEVTSLMSELEKTRRQLHRAKFFMKAVNNFLTALTPFFFYSIGGYLVIEGGLTLGALVAVLAAYKDFSSPVRQLFKYYQTVEDVRIRFQELRLFLSTSGSDSGETADYQAESYG